MGNIYVVNDIRMARRNNAAKKRYLPAEAPEYRKKGFASLSKYRDWQLEQNEVEARRRLAAGKRKSILRTLDIANLSNVRCRDIHDPVQAEICRALKRSRFSRILRATLLHLESRSKLLQSCEYIKGICALVDWCCSWRRLIEDWRPQSHNPGRQFASLLRHLLADFDVPVFMDAAWLSDNKLQQAWFVHIAGGRNIRSAAGLPVPLTKKMAHHFLRAPVTYGIEEALRWGQVHALGGDKRLADALRDTRLVRHFEHNEFWLSVLRFFIAHPFLDLMHVNPIVDFIQYQRFEQREVFVARGVTETQPPPQPNFSMRGRSPEALLRQVEGWHRRLGRESSGASLQWQRSPMREYSRSEGSSEKGNRRIWTIRELLSARELINEGRRMQHCVASYARSCYAGRSSIWTLEMCDDIGTHKLLTIEVANVGRRIVQARGKRNRMPSAKELSILRYWAAREDIRLAPHIV